jgi:hypothetical protein
MADRIGVARKWIQKAGTDHEHFDICKSKRELAVRAGAKPITMYELALILQKREIRRDWYEERAAHLEFDAWRAIRSASSRGKPGR